MVSITDVWILANLDQDDLRGFGVLRIFRLRRLARIVRLLHVCKELYLLEAGLALSIQAVLWVFVLLGALMYIGALLTCLLIGNYDEDNAVFFGSVGSALFTHFKEVTPEGWPGIADASMKLSPLWGVYWIFLIMVTNMPLLNLVTGVVVEKVHDSASKDIWEHEMYSAEIERVQETLKDLFLIGDTDMTGDIGLEEFKIVMKHKMMWDVLEAFEVSLEVDPEHLFQIVDADDSGTLSFEEWTTN